MLTRAGLLESGVEFSREEHRMARHSSKLVIYAALAGNLLVAGTKFAAAAFTVTGASASLMQVIDPTAMRKGRL
jgi:hypothetical protein